MQQVSNYNSKKSTYACTNLIYPEAHLFILKIVFYMQEKYFDNFLMIWNPIQVDFGNQYVENKQNPISHGLCQTW